MAARDGTRGEMASSDGHRHSGNYRPTMQHNPIYESDVQQTGNGRQRQTNGHVYSSRQNGSERRGSIHSYHAEDNTVYGQPQRDHQERRRSLHPPEEQNRSRRPSLENGGVPSIRVDYSERVQRSVSPEVENASHERGPRDDFSRPHRLDFAHRQTTDPRARRYSDPRAQPAIAVVTDQPRGRNSEYREVPRGSDRPNNFRAVSSATTHRSNEDTDARYVVPALPMPVAVVCCLLNFLLPGFGSMCASVCVFCCARTGDMTCREKLGSCCTVFGIGVLQLLLVACFLIGWIWSCIWGITFIGMSASFYDDDEDYRYEAETGRTHDSSRSHQTNQHRGRTPLPAPQVVEDQPFPGVRYEDVRRERDRRRHRPSRPRRSPRIPLTSSNLIYPMRAPSNIAYNSPPPPYRETETPLPGAVNRNGEPPPAYSNSRDIRTQRQHNSRHVQTAQTIQEEDFH